VASIALLCGAALLAGGCKRTQDAASKPAAEAAAGVVDLPTGPLTRHEQTCARCHGPQGMFHGDAFRRLGPAELAAAVERMWTQTAGLPPAPAEQAAMVAYHQALQAGRPFMCLTNAASFYAGREDVLRGEVTPGATPRATAGGRELSVRVDGARFALPGCPRGPVLIRARLGAYEALLEAPRRTWSE
jgi:hypothetical protein